MKPDAYFKWLRGKLHNAAAETIHETVVIARDRMRRRIPSKRIKTRRALRYQVRRTSQGYRAEIKLKFGESYRFAGTPTEQVIARAWEQTESEVGDVFLTRLDNHIRSI